MGSYPVGLVGEAHYQGAIAQLRVGDPIKLTPEPDNPYDPRAVAAVHKGLGTVGYLARDSWLTVAMLDSGTKVAARVQDIPGEGRGMRGVVLEVRTGAEARAALEASATAGIAPVHETSVLTRIVTAIVVVLILLAALGQCGSPEVADEAAGLSTASSKGGGSAKSDRLALSVAWFSRILTANEPCDAGWDKIHPALERIGHGGDRFDAFAAAKDASAVCKTSWLAIGELPEAEGLSEAGARAAAKANDICAAAAFVRMGAAEAAMKVINGDSRPSVVNEAGDQARSAAGMVLACAAGGIKLARAEKLDPVKFAAALKAARLAPAAARSD